MAKTLDDTLKVLKRRAGKLGPEHAGLYGALDRHYEIEVANTLADLRRSKKLSQAQLGRRAGIQQAEVSRILSGRSNPRVTTVQKLARAMGSELRIVPARSARVSKASSKREGARRR